MSHSVASSRRHIVRLVALNLILLVVLLALSASNAVPSRAQTPDAAPRLARSLDGMSRTHGPARAALRHPKMESAVARVVRAAAASVADGVSVAQSERFPTAKSEIELHILSREGAAANVSQLVRDLGGHVDLVGAGDRIIQALLPVSAIATVAAAPDVLMLRRPAPATLAETVPLGGSTTEALAVMNVPAWHGNGYTGSGVRIGIVDIGFAGYSDLLGSELPAGVVARSFVAREPDDPEGTSVHGAAVAEVVHDIAPDATLYLARVSSALELEAAADWLADTQQVDIISTSINWKNLTPGDGTGILADIVHPLRQSGVLWVASAGNYRQQHWGGLFDDPEADGFHNFAGSAELNQFIGANDELQYFEAGTTLEVDLRWNDWDSPVDQDFDLSLYHWNSDAEQWEEVARSDDVQDGSPGQQPTETVLWEVQDPGYYAAAIFRFSASRAVNFDLIAATAYRLDVAVFARSLGNLGDVPDALAVAAVDVAAPHAHEPDSSEGPTNGPGGAATGGFIKPDIAGFANVSSQSYGSGGFSDASAASPHVTGAAALVRSAHPEWTPDLVQSFLETRAVDDGAPGMDTVFGHGRLYLGEAPPPQTTGPHLYLPIILRTANLPAVTVLAPAHGEPTGSYRACPGARSPCPSAR